MATKHKPRKKKISHSNNLTTTGLFKRRDDVQVALQRLEQMTPEQKTVLLKALEHTYGSVYFRINVTSGTYEKVGNDIDIYMLMKIFWDLEIHIYSLPLGDYKDGMTVDDLDHYVLEYKHRSPATVGDIRELSTSVLTRFIDAGTDLLIGYIDFYPVLPTVANQPVSTAEPYAPGDILNIHYEYDPLDPGNAEFKHRPRTCDKTNGWSQKKYEENRNAILHTLLSD